MWLDDVATYLDVHSTALTLLSGTAGNMPNAFMPDADPAPDTIVALLDRGAGASLITLSTDNVFSTTEYHEHGLQILARSTSYTTAYDLAADAYRHLSGMSERRLPTSTGSRYLSVTAVSRPFSIGRDRNDRFLVSSNYILWRQPDSVVPIAGAFDSAFSSAFDLAGVP